MYNNRLHIHDKPESQLAYRLDIDGLRAIAVLSVVICHAFPTFLPGGFVGVDIFFVISGFLISSIIFHNLANNTFSLQSFYARRVRRIFPALILVLITTAAIGWLISSPAEYKQLGIHIGAGAGFFINLILWGEAGYFDTETALKPLMHLWSLAVEEQFYLIYPLVITTAWRIKSNIPTTIILLFVTSFILNLTRVELHNAETFFMLHTRFWELLGGCILAYLDIFQRNRLIDGINMTLRNCLSALGLFCITTSVVSLHSVEHFPGWQALLPVGGAVLIIFAGSSAWLNQHLLSSPLLVFIGLISYPLYLWHWPLLSYARIIEGHTQNDIQACIVLLSIVLSWLTYEFVEKFFRAGSARVWKTTVLMAVMACVGYLGFYVHQQSGLPSRFPQELKTLAEYKYDYSVDARIQACWLTEEQGDTAFSPQCLNKPNTEANSQSVFIWGDSHAARLYPGIKLFLSEGVHISQFTRNRCPPILEYSYPVCIKSNQFVLSAIKQYRPKIIILFSDWTAYAKSPTEYKAASQKLLYTISQLKIIGIEKIVVVGPAPKWFGLMPDILLKASNRDYLHRVPARTDMYLDPLSQSIDADFKGLFKDKPVTYFSIAQILCNAEGCLTHVPGDPQSLITYDHGHLTTPAALFIARQLAVHINPANLQNR